MKFARVVKLGFVNFYRNVWLSAAASFMMMLTLLIVGAFLVLSMFSQKITNGIQEKIDLTVYFYDSATDQEIKDLSDQLALRPDVKSIHYVSKDEALTIWQIRNRTSPRIRELVTKDENPLPRSLEVKSKDPENLKTIADFSAGDSYKSIVRRVSYEENKATVERLIKITKTVDRFGWGLSIFFVLISILVVYNTIRLTIFSRKQEIEVMRLVGASDSYIRLPFMIEAMLYGLIATIVSILLITLAIVFIAPSVSGYLGDLNLSITKFYFSWLWLLFLIEFIIGIGISVICSLLAMKRYLKI